MINPEGQVFFAGSGTPNGQQGFEFQVSAVEGSPDRVRVRIWVENGLYDYVIYDTQAGAALDAAAAMPLTSGSITVVR